MLPALSENVPVGQSILSMEEFPILQYFPAGHKEQNDEPYIFEYFPRVHAEHFVDSSESENDPGSHNLQDVNPSSLEYRPTEHGKHSCHSERDRVQCLKRSEVIK